MFFASQGFVFLLLTEWSFQKEHCAGGHLFPTCFWCFFVVIWERSGAVGCFCEAVRWAPFTAISQGGIHEARGAHFLLPEKSQPFQAEEDEGEEEGEGEAGDMKDRIISRKRSYGDVAGNEFMMCMNSANMWGFTVFGYLVLIKTYQQLVFFEKGGSWTIALVFG